MGNTTHTKEPWSYQIAPCGTSAVFMEEDGTTIMGIVVRENTTAHSRLPHNLARVAAPIKGTEGIDTDLLQGFSPRYLAMYPDRALRERQEAQWTIQKLVAAAKEVLQHVEGALPNRGWLRDNHVSRQALHALREAALATLANQEVTDSPTINVNGFNVPAPMCNAPDDGTPYWVPVPSSVGLVVSFTWQGTAMNLHHLEYGLMHSMGEAAEAHARAMLKLDLSAV